MTRHTLTPQRFAAIVSACAVIGMSFLPLSAFASTRERNDASYEKSAGTAHVESESHPETKAVAPLVPTQRKSASTLEVVPATAVAGPSLGENLIKNPSVETESPGGLPAHWHKGGYGSNSRTLTYPALPASDGAAALAVHISSRTSGDAKWYFDDVPVTPGANYRFSDEAKGSVPSIITARYAKSDGSYSYVDLATVPASDSYRETSVDVTIPQDTVSMTVFHLLSQTGTLLTDSYSLRAIDMPATEPPVANVPGPNLIANGDFEIGSNAPQAWRAGGWGSNTRSFSYPAQGARGTRAAKVEITSRTSGDAKWYFAPVPVAPGVYTYADQYQASIPSIVTVEFRAADGSLRYQDIATLPASDTFREQSIDFTVPAGVTAVSVFHLINAVGSLTIDDASLVAGATPEGIFATGAVSLRFDDGWLSQLQNAVPVMDEYGFKGTFYIVSRQTLDDGFAGFMSHDQVRALYRDGHEIGAHTRTHPHLTALSAAAQRDEIAGSREDLQTWDVGPIDSFAYPYGSYDPSALSLVRDAGYTSAAATIDGDVTPLSDPYQLEYEGIESDTTLAQVESWIDDAAARHVWLILTFHQIDDTLPDLYSTTPAMFRDIAAYIEQKKLPVLTVSEGVHDLARH